MNKRSFLQSLLLGCVAPIILPSSLTYDRIWKFQGIKQDRQHEIGGLYVRPLQNGLYIYLHDKGMWLKVTPENVGPLFSKPQSVRYIYDNYDNNPVEKLLKNVTAVNFVSQQEVGDIIL